MVFGCSQDKNYEAMLRLIVPRCTSLITTQANSPRAMDAQQLGWLALQIGLKNIRAVISPPEAVRECLRAAAAHEIVSVTGSFFVAGEVADAWQKGILP
jgi:folylpolyglutamate synthase/dihydropteroate synthase